MKEILTEWRKFINEDLYGSFDRPKTDQGMRDYFKSPEATIDNLISEVLNEAEQINAFINPYDSSDLEGEHWRGEEAKEGPRAAMSDINIYVSNWFENHEVQEEDKSSAEALKTFVDWLNRNVEEMMDLSFSEENWQEVISSKPHKILQHIVKNEPDPSMLMSLGPQLDKF
tara:strand:+ start:19 stop:531 length:513 start_codon:yes stop_codon:yes gene_type:complete